MQKKTIVLNGNFTSPVNVNSSLNVDGNVNVNGELIINDKSIDETLNNRIKPIEDLHLSADYTAFEVFPTTEEIPAGTVSQDIVYGKWWKSNTAYSVGSYVLVKNQEKLYTCIKAVAKTNSIEPGITEGWEEYWVEGNEDFDGYYYKYTKAVPANNTINTYFFINSKTREDCNIVIDWGDGTVSKVADLNDNSVKSFGNFGKNLGPMYTYGYLTMTHTYTDCVSRIENGKLVESKKYIVKIYGKDYFMVRFGNDENNNIVSRICDSDLPISSNVTNISSAASGSLRILYLNVPYLYNFKNVTNFYCLIGYCDNLRYAIVDSSTKFNIDNAFSIGKFLAYNMNLSRASIYPTSYVYQEGFLSFATGCTNLHEDVLKILPKHGFAQNTDMFKAFNGCTKLTCSDYNKLADMLWNNTNVKFTNTVSCFAGCSDEFRSHVPKTWGGDKA